MEPSEQQLVVVSGASSGIDLAMVKTLLAQDFAVLGLSRHFDDLVRRHPKLRHTSVD